MAHRNVIDGQDWSQDRVVEQCIQGRPMTTVGYVVLVFVTLIRGSEGVLAIYARSSSHGSPRRGSLVPVGSEAASLQLESVSTRLSD